MQPTQEEINEIVAAQIKSRDNEIAALKQLLARVSCFVPGELTKLLAEINEALQKP